MKAILFLLLFLILSVSSSAQSGLSFKIYQNTDIFQTQSIGDQTGHVITENNINFSRISVAIDWQTKKGFFHEAELLIPEFSKPVEKLQFPMQYEFRRGIKLEREATSFSMRYEIYKSLTSKSDRIDLLFGMGMNPYYVHLEFTPTIPNTYSSSMIFYGLALNVTPRLYYKVNQFFSIDLNVPIRMYNLQGVKTREDNPILPLRQQRRNQFNHLFFEPVYTIRLGLRYMVPHYQK